MIKTKQELKYYLKMDAVALWQTKEKPSLIWRGVYKDLYGGMRDTSECMNII